MAGSRWSKPLHQALPCMSSSYKDGDECFDSEGKVSKIKNWEDVVNKNSGTHPSVGHANTSLLNRMRCSAVSAVLGAGMHPDRKLYVSNPRTVNYSDFKPTNKYKEG